MFDGVKFGHQTFLICSGLKTLSKMIFIVSSGLLFGLFSNFIDELCFECVVTQFQLWFLRMICNNLLGFLFLFP